VATIVQAGIHRMYSPDSTDPDVFYYLTLYNENYPMPAMPEGLDPAHVVRGLYRWAPAAEGTERTATVLFSGSANGAARAAAQELLEHHGIGVELWSATSYKALRDDALSTERWNRLHPDQPGRTPLVTELLAGAPGPILAVTDFMKIVPEQVARFLPGRTFVPLGTDGMGRSDTREALRRYFEVDAGHVVVGVLSALLADGRSSADEVRAAMERHGIDPDADDPLHV
jgi:pyruvate dehydrogenase E1 component